MHFYQNVSEVSTIKQFNIEKNNHLLFIFTTLTVECGLSHMCTFPTRCDYLMNKKDIIRTNV